MIILTPHIYTTPPTARPPLSVHPKEQTIISLDVGQAENASFSMTYLLPAPLVENTNTKKDNNKRIAEQFMGMAATCKINRHLDSMSEATPFLGNSWTWPQLSWDISAGKPIFLRCVEELGNSLSKPDIRRWFEQACIRPRDSTSRGQFSTSLNM